MQLKMTDEMNKKAFTLAEVLITLGIIGVVAAMTIPTLIQDSQEKATVSGLKKVFATLSQAYTLAVQENGTPDEWGMLNAGSSTPMLATLGPYLKVAKDCSTGISGCWPAGVKYKPLASSMASDSPYDGQSYPKYKLADGTQILSFTDWPTCSGSAGGLTNLCGRYWVDINGEKLPNQWGKDTFEFWLKKEGILPMGGPNETGWYSYASNCRDKDSMSGAGCAAWVIYNENMDYLKCSDLSWTGKKKCS